MYVSLLGLIYQSLNKKVIVALQTQS